MNPSIVHHDGGRVSSDSRPGRRAGVASLLMIPALVLSFTVAELVGAGVQSALDLAEDDNLREAGIVGVLAGLGLTALLVLPAVVGIVLGLRARRLGESRLGTPGVVINAALAGYLVLVSVVQLVLGSAPPWAADWKAVPVACARCRSGIG